MHAVFPGSFDPPTYGHLHIIERCAVLFKRVDVVIANNKNKKNILSVEERLDILSNLFKKYSNVKVYVWKTLIVEFIKKHKADILIRGVRSASDYEYEFMLAHLNKGLGKGVETLFMPTDQKYFVLRSSVIKEIIMLGGDVSDKVPPRVLNILKKKLLVDKEHSS